MPLPNSLELIIQQLFSSDIHNIDPDFESNSSDVVFPKADDLYMGEPYTDNFRLKNLVIPEGTTRIAPHAFARCSNLEDVIIPESVREIGAGAFAGCCHLKRVILPDGVSYIGDSAFTGCTGLKEVSFPQILDIIGDSAFAGCTSLKELLLPDNVSGIGRFAFMGCTSLKDALLPKNLTHISEGVFEGCTSLTHVTLPDALKSLDPHTFKGTPWLKQPEEFLVHNGILLLYSGAGGNVVVPPGVTHIGDGAFQGCKRLSSVILPQGLTMIGSHAFQRCRQLKSIVIPEGVTSIGHSAFEGCTSLSDVSVPQSMRVICSNAFEGCTSLKGVAIPQSVESISGNPFMPDRFLPDPGNPDDSRLLRHLSPDGKLWLRQHNGFNIVNGVLIRYTGCEKHIAIPKDVTIVGSNAFHACTVAERISIPESVTVICSHAFSHCEALTSMVIPPSVSWLGHHVFACCASLLSIVLPDRQIHLGNMNFQSCFRLRRVVLPAGLDDLDQQGLNASEDLQFLRCPGVPLPHAGTQMKPAMLRSFITDPDAYSDERKAEYGRYLKRHRQEILTAAITNDDAAPFAACEQLNIRIPPVLRDELLRKAESEEHPAVLTWLMDYKHRTADLAQEARDRARTEAQMLINPFMAKFLRSDWRWSKLEDGSIRIDKYVGRDAEVCVPPMVGKAPVTSIADRAFSNCNNLTDVIIPEGVTSIGHETFSGCGSLQNVTIPKSVVRISPSAFNGTPWQNQQAPFFIINGILLKYHGQDKVVTIPDGVTHIGDETFCDSWHLTHVIIPKGVTHIGARAFANCVELRRLTIPDGVTHIGNNAFRDCLELQSISLPDSLTSPGLHLFRSCPLLTEIIASDEVQARLQACHSLTQELCGVTVAVSGHLRHQPRQSAFGEIVLDFGGHMTDSVSARTTCLITNNLSSITKKVADAQRLGVPILTEDEFRLRYFPHGLP